MSGGGALAGCCSPRSSKGSGCTCWCPSHASHLSGPPPRSLDDVVCCTFLAGNDFVPQLPSLDIYDRPSALQTLLDAYKVQGLGRQPGPGLARAG